MSDNERRYSDQDVRKIIERALTLQKKEQKTRSISASEGSSITDIDAIAGEVGISANLIHRAAAELDFGRETGRKNRYLGGEIEPESVASADRVVTQPELERIFMMLPSLAGESGLGNVLGSNLTWSSSPESVMKTSRSTNITISSSGTGTRVTVQDRLGQIAAGIFGGLIGGLGIGGGLGVGFGVGSGVLGSWGFTVLFSVGMLAASFFLSRSIFSLVWKMRKKRIREIAEKIRAFIESGSQGSNDRNA